MIFRGGHQIQFWVFVLFEKYALYVNGDLCFSFALKLKVEFHGRVNSFQFACLNPNSRRRRTASDRLGKEAHASWASSSVHLHHHPSICTIVGTIIRPSWQETGLQRRAGTGLQRRAEDPGSLSSGQTAGLRGGLQWQAGTGAACPSNETRI